MIRIICVLFGCLILSASPLNAQTIICLTENACPMICLKDGKAVGLIIEIVDTILKKADITYKIEILPWARAYRMALNNKNTLIFPIYRTPERESLFKWVGRIIPVRYYLFKLRDRTDIIVNQLSDAKKYKIGVLRDDVRHKFLKENGFEHLKLVTSNEQNLGKLMIRRIDLFPMSQIGMVGLCAKSHYDCSKLEKGFELKSLSKGLSMAYSRKTSDAILERAKGALKQIKAEGRYKRLLDELLRVKLGGHNFFK